MSEVKTKVGVKRVSPESSSSRLLYSPSHTCAVFPSRLLTILHAANLDSASHRIGSRQISIYFVEMFWRQEQVSSTVSRPNAVSTCAVPNDMRRSTPRRVMCRTCLECAPPVRAPLHYQSNEWRVASEKHETELFRSLREETGSRGPTGWTQTANSVGFHAAP
jgi:hypothetical protein